jgi:hypothetical protein
MFYKALSALILYFKGNSNVYNNFIMLANCIPISGLLALNPNMNKSITQNINPS